MNDKDERIGYLMKMLAEGQIKVTDNEVKKMWMGLMNTYIQEGDYMDNPKADKSEDREYFNTVLQKGLGVSQKKSDLLVFTIKVPKIG